MDWGSFFWVVAAYLVVSVAVGLLLARLLAGRRSGHMALRTRREEPPT